MNLAFVIPWYGEKITGGAESACRELAKHLAENNHVEILTTCVKDFSSDWSVNFHKAGEEYINKLLVKRFPVKKRNTDLFDQVNYKFMNGITVDPEEEVIFLEEMVNSPELYSYIKSHSCEYDYFIFIPYMFGTTYYGIQQCPEKSVVIPCFHDESYIRIKAFDKVFNSIKGMVFLSEPEKDLAERMFGLDSVQKEVLGLGINDNIAFDADHKLGYDYIIYAGRKDSGKNVGLLIEYYLRGLDDWKNTKLVLIGGGQIEIPYVYRENIIDMGYVSDNTKYSIFHNAICLCQPSYWESFSIVIMESWKCETPILVPTQCAVTTDFCRKANGGLYYSDYDEFHECLLYFINNKEKAKKIGTQGTSYVKDNFVWTKVADNYNKFLINI